MKIIYFADSHLRLNVPVRRKENMEDWSEKIFSKIEKILQISKGESADMIICGGDFFDYDTPSYTLYNRVADVLKNNEIPFYIVPGNHDIFNANINTLYRTALMGLERSNLVNVFVDSIVKDNVEIIPIPYMIEEANFKYEKKSDFQIIIPHLMLSDSELPFDFYLIDNIETNADLFLCSDYHKPFDKLIGDTRYVNPGSLLRLSAIEHNYNRNPKVAMIDIEDEILVSYIEFDEFGISDEIFDRVEKEKEDDNFENFLNFVKEFKNSESMSILKTIDLVAKEYDVEKEIVDEVKRILV